MCKNNKNIGLLIIRLGVGVLFLMAGIMKVAAVGPEMIAMVGGAAHKIGLTFLSQDVWFWMAAIGEIVAGVLFIAGFLVPVASILAIIIMFVAFASMGYDMQTGMVTVIFAITSLGLGFTGPGMWSVKGLMCKKCCPSTGACCPTKEAPKM